MANMTPNKQFNTYKVGLDLELLWEYCMEHGEWRVMERGEMMGRRASRPEWLTYPIPPTICCPIRITVTEQRKDSEILDAGEREHEEMNDITAIWSLKRHKVTHVWKKVVIPVQSFWKSGIYVNRGRMFSMDIEQRFD